MILFLKFLLILIFATTALCFTEELKKYFGSASVKQFSKDWKTYKKSYDNAIQKLLTETFSRQAMNVYYTNKEEKDLLSEGFYVDDPIGHILFSRMRIIHLPVLTTSYVNFDLASNILKFEGSLDRLIVQADYNVFIESSNDVSSPFADNSVKKIWLTGIIADNCRLSSESIVLVNPMIDLRSTNMVLSHCDFSIEIPRHEKDTFIVPYFTGKQREQLQRIITRPIKQELMKHLRSGLVSMINITEVFGKNTLHYKSKQAEAFKISHDYFDKVVRSCNENVIKSQKFYIKLEPLKISTNYLDNPLYYDTVTNKDAVKIDNVEITDCVLTGLDSLCTSHSGGPYIYEGKVGILDLIEYPALQVSGKLSFDKDGQKVEHKMVLNIKDFAVNIYFYSQSEVKLNVDGWRSMDTTIFNVENVGIRPILKAILHGYVLSTMPSAIEEYLKNLLLNVKLKLKFPFNDDDFVYSSDNKKKKYTTTTTTTENSISNETETPVESSTDASEPVVSAEVHEEE